MLVSVLAISSLADAETVAPSKATSWQVQYPEKRLHSGRWSASSKDTDCRLILNSYTKGELYLQSRDQSELQLVLDAPLTTAAQRSSVLLLEAAPWHEYTAATRLSNGSFQENGTVLFRQNISQLADKLFQGYWGRINLKSTEGKELSIAMSSVDFQVPYNDFSACRKKLPPVRFEKIKKTSVFFDSGGSVLNDSSPELDLIRRYQEYDPKAITSITIDGYSDSSGPQLRNLDLSRYRAKAVETYLISAGIDKTLIKAVRHHGERYPDASQRSNRRVDVRLNTDNETVRPDTDTAVKDAKLEK
ncbi:OmpA family protein [Endozoicomonas ascidiicola]|uniref:MotY family protein n=1 Tax=Endozoicomonas ascidiicola TaxID=1698521 RepID=UPI0012FA1D74|nr:OmpA family protein [Endozoicomonas ascidiicola]